MTRRSRQMSAKILFNIVVTIAILSAVSVPVWSAGIIIAGPDTAKDGSRYTVSEGVAPYYWCISKGTINQDGVVSLSGTCGSATITVTNACGNSNTKEIKIINGEWIPVNIETAKPSNCTNGPIHLPIECLTFDGKIATLGWDDFNGKYYYCTDFNKYCAGDKRIAINPFNPPNTLITGTKYTYNRFLVSNPSNCEGAIPADLISSSCGVNVSVDFVRDSTFSNYEWRCKDGSNGLQR